MPAEAALCGQTADTSVVDVMMLLPDLSEESPAGDNLELDVEFSAMERASQGRPETQYGDTINPATPPDWAETEAIALRLLERTRDLRVLTHLAVARLHLAGVPGFAEALAQIRHQLESRWREVHPQLDPDDNNDTTLRANALVRLRDPANVLRALRDLALATSPKTGSISWRDVAVFNGQAEPAPGRDKPTELLIRGAFQETDPARLRRLREAVDQAVHEVVAIPMAFDLQAGPGAGPDFTDLARLLTEMQTILRRFEVAAPAVAEDPADPEPMELPTPAGVIEETTAPAPRRAPAPALIGVRSIGAVTTRADALYCLELATAYFRTNEPSSPVPMLISRAQRLAVMEFLDILRDLAPDGVAQAQIVAGSTAE
jgi:type VI secretion system protein ImpA